MKREILDITPGSQATISGELVEYQLKGQEKAFSTDKQIRVRGGVAKACAGELLCIAGEITAERRSKVAMFSGRATIVDSEVRLPSGAEDCLIVAHGRSKICLSMGIRMCEIIAAGETVVYVPRDRTVPPGSDEVVISTRGLYSCNIDLQGNARIEYLP